MTVPAKRLQLYGLACKLAVVQQGAAAYNGLSAALDHMMNAFAIQICDSLR